MYAVLVIIN